MRHFLSTLDWSQAELLNLISKAENFKKQPIQDLHPKKSMALVFFNPSLRTRSSFDLGMYQLGGKAIVLEPGKGSWPIEFAENVVMDDLAEEHIKEVAQVLSRYFDIIGVRAFPKFLDWQEDRQDKVIQSFARYASVPVINMETITHPCQELALLLAMKEKLAELKNKKFVLTWTYHPKPLNTAVANSALILATKMGMDVTLLCPNADYALDSRYMDAAKENVQNYGGSFKMSHDIEESYGGAHMVYAKSWGAIPYFGNWEAEKPIREKHKRFMVDSQKMALTDNGFFSHCLPVRRNIKVSDEVLDSPASIAIEEAENRLHVQKAVIDTLLKLK